MGAVSLKNTVDKGIKSNTMITKGTLYPSCRRATRSITHTTMMRKGKNNLKRMVHFGRKGFTLIEVLVGFVILAVGMLAIAAMQITSTKSGYFSNNVTQASVLAQDKLEHLKNLSYRHSDLSGGQHNEGTISGTIFSRQYTVAEDAGNSIKIITVTVQWTDRENHNISFSTIRSR